MAMNNFEFFGNNTLVGYFYYYFLQSYQFEEKQNLSEEITKKGGVYSYII